MGRPICYGLGPQIRSGRNAFTRDDLNYNGEALLARDHLLRTAADAAELGAWCGFGGALLCLVLIRRRERDYPNRCATSEPDPIGCIDARARNPRDRHLIETPV